MSQDSTPSFGPEETAACQKLIAAGLEEDWGQAGDVTSRALVPERMEGAARLVARRAGVLAGVDAARTLFLTVLQRCERCSGPLVLRRGKHGEFLGCRNYPKCRYARGLDDDAAITWQSLADEGSRLQAGQGIAHLRGHLRLMLMCERLALNFLQRLSGVATLTRRFVDAVAGLRCGIYDTRKTTPGWRVLEKHAVRVGGGHNHRIGLYDAVLIKDNHIAAWRRQADRGSLADLVRAARAAVPAKTPVELEVDSLAQFKEALPGEPDIVLLDNMSVEQLRQIVALRNQCRPQLVLEASGGITLENVRAVAETGVDRISVGVITHSAPALDIALDFEEPAA